MIELATPAAVAALGARLVRAQRLPPTIAATTDTRRLRPGETFLALRGANFDGHAFLAEAAARGAAAAIVDDPSALPDELPGIVVADTGAAYLALGALARAHLRGPVVALTGSTGKTTTKELLAQALRAAGRDAVATPENENNEIGVPKLLLACDDGDERVVVVEMGARHYGDIAPLVAAVQPAVAVLTNVGDAHLEIMGSRERLAETKWAIFGTGAHAVLNLADAVSRERAPALAAPRTWFGLDAERPPAGERALILTDDGLLVLAPQAREISLHVALPGDHNRRNLAAALAAAWAVGVDPADVAAARPSFHLPAGRYERLRLAGGPTVIYDAYNASRSGAIATLAAFGREDAAGRRIAVLSSMAELGPEAAALHEDVGAAAARVADVVLVGGDFAPALAAGARRAGLPDDALIPFADNEAAAVWLREHAGPGDLVLLKGSRMYRMEQIVARLGR